MKQWLKSPKKMLVLSLVLVLIFSILSAGMLRSWGKVSIRDTSVTTAGGNRVAVRIYKPASASAAAPAPAIVFTHGLTVNKESYSQYGMELAKRGFVVIMPDMLNHGDSEVTPAGVYLAPYFVSDAYGAYAAVRYAKTLDYVDKSQLAVAGHSAGGQASNNCIRLDNAEETPAISAIYLIASDPMYKDEEGNWANLYGARDVGVLYTTYDHVYYRGTDASGATLGVQDYLKTEEAKSLFSFGADPASLTMTEVLPNTTYTGEVEGKSVIRRITQIDAIHPMPQGNTAGVVAAVDFFQTVFDAPNEIPAENNSFVLLTVINVLGILSILVAAVYVLACVLKLKFFASLAAAPEKALRPAPSTVKGKAGFWILTVLNCVFAFVSISLIFAYGFGYCCFTFLPQQPSNIYAFWALLNGAFMLLTSFGSYWLYGKKDGASMELWGLKIAWVDFFKSILAALAVCAFVFVITLIENTLFKINFNCFLWGLKNVPLANLGVFFKYFPFYLVFGLAVSIAINSAYYNRIGNEPEWVNELFFAVMNLIPSLAITLIGFSIYAKTGVKPFIFGSTYTFTYTINAIPVFPIAIILIRRLFKQCNNAYIPGIIAAILMCWLQVSCSFTVVANMYYGPMAAFLP
ncbi:MAG: alpha/beta fold hydrolase [Oscillospiraceae bacterium]|nr:alpha/beta fold hydrolase [Oscillospiraceae bacterium]